MRHLSLRTLAVAAAIGYTCAAATAASAQDPKAVEHATALRKRGATADEIVADLARTFRLDASGVAQVTGRIDLPAGEALPALERAFRIDVAAAAGALEKGGYAAGPTATALASRRVPPADGAAALRGAGYATEEAVPAFVAAFGLALAEASVPLRDAGYAIDDVAGGLRRVAGASDAAVLASLSLADFAPTELRRVAVGVLGVSPEDYAASMKAAGVYVVEVAHVLIDAYDLAPAPGGTVLRGAGYTDLQVVHAFRLAWELDLAGAHRALRDMGRPALLLWRFLADGGYELDELTIHRYRIADYRPEHGGQWIENIGVVDPARVTPIAPDPWHGEVEILLGYAGLEQLAVTLAGRAGEIVGREPHTFEVYGNTRDGEWLRVRFHDFASGDLRVQGLGWSSRVPADALAFHVMDAELIEGPLRALAVTLGDPVGTGTVTLPAGTYGGIPVTGETMELEVPAHEQAGVRADVAELSSSGVAVSTQAAGEGVVQIQIEVAFEENGPEVEGSFLEYIPCWKCSTFEIPLSECPGVNIPCLIAAIGTGVGSLGSCTNPENWEEVQVAAGPALPFEADLTSARLDIDITIGPQGSGPFAALSVLPRFTADVALRSQVGGLSAEPIQNWILGQVNMRLMAALQEMDLGGSLVQALETARSTLGWGHVRGVYVLGDGRWFIDAKH